MQMIKYAQKCLQAQQHKVKGDALRREDNLVAALIEYRAALTSTRKTRPCKMSSCGREASRAQELKLSGSTHRQTVIITKLYMSGK